MRPRGEHARHEVWHSRRDEHGAGAAIACRWPACGSGRPQGPTLHARSCERVLVEPVGGVQASDHYGVFAELVVPQRPPGTQGVLD